ncbi:MAG: hypothetical protein CVU39_04045 [Chloroflexi bacterium HGW-Chloroflexi-10]|nr:MAG: hypothetical protein CVU39_04045 [Chloroflexi bacterium HGW-Chloroflexi-10]
MFTMIKNKPLILLLCLVIIFVGCMSVSPNTLGKSVTANSTSTGVYLPLLMKEYPAGNIFGAQLAVIDDAHGLSMMKEANSGWTRLDYSWASVEPTEGSRNWGNVSSLDQQIANGDAKGVKTILIIGLTPDWAVFPNISCNGKIKQEKFQAFANFMYDLVSRYSKPPFNVTHYEMWNEPDVVGGLGCWGDSSDNLYYGGSYYGEMLKTVYGSMKRADPNAQVLVGGLLLDCDPALELKNDDNSPKSCLSANFLKGILEAGASNSFDGIAFHAYDYYAGILGQYSNPNFAGSWNTTGPVTSQKAKYLRNVLSQYNASQKYLLNTESGIFCFGDSCNDPAYGFQVTKAYYIAQEMTVALADEYVSNIWYSVYGVRESGLLNNSNQPYQAYYAFGVTSKSLQGYKFSQKLSLGTGMLAYEFVNSSGSKQWVLWANDGNLHPISLPGMPKSIQRISDTGQAENISPSTTVNVHFAPVFIKY